MDNVMSKDDRLFKVDDIPYVHSYIHTLFCIARCGRKYKTIYHIKGFIKHMQRLQETLNSDEEKRDLNRIIVGSEDLYEDTVKYLCDCKQYKTSTVGRELMLTCTPQFFKGMDQDEIYKWVDHNVDWLKEYFHDNLRYVCLHLDESTPHLHILVIPKQWSEKKKCYTLQAYKYFNGPAKLRAMQDSYAEHMQKKYPVLQRGVKNSRAKNISIKTFYGLVTKDLDENDIESLKAHARNSHLMGIKNKRLEQVIRIYKEGHLKDLKDKEENQQEIEHLKEELNKYKGLENIYKEVVKKFAKSNKLENDDADRLLKNITENDKIKDILKTKSKGNK